MVCVVNLDNPEVRYHGDVLMEALQPGQKLAVRGPQGCVTSAIVRIWRSGEKRILIETKNSRYFLTQPDDPMLDKLELLAPVDRWGALNADDVTIGIAV